MSMDPIKFAELVASFQQKPMKQEDSKQAGAGLTDTISGLWKQWKSKGMASGSGMGSQWTPQATPGVASRQFGIGGIGN